MEENNMKVNGMIRKASFIICAIGLIIFNLVGFLMGAQRENFASFLTVIIASNLMIILEEVLILLETKGNKTTLYRLLGFPMHFWALVTIAIQFVFLLVVTIVNMFIDFPFIVTIIVEVLLLAFFVIQFVFGYLVRYFSLGLDSKINAKTANFEELRKRINAVLVEDLPDEVKKNLSEVSEKMRYLNPVASKETQEIDTKIESVIFELENYSFEEDKTDYDDALRNIKLLDNLLTKREVLAKR